MTPRWVLVIAALLFPLAGAMADGNPLPPVGTVFEGSFNLGYRDLPLPEGRFVVAATSLDEARLFGGDASKQRSQLARAILVQTERDAVRAAVWATVALKPQRFRFEWITRACSKEDTLFRADLTGPGAERENCLLVDHAVGNFTPKSQGLFKETTAKLAEDNVRLPVPLLIVANVTRTEGWQVVRTSYAFNPRAFGCDIGRSPSWAASPWHRTRIGDDPQKVRFVESVTAWGKVVQVQIDEIVGGKNISAKASSANPIHGCP